MFGSIFPYACYGLAAYLSLLLLWNVGFTSARMALRHNLICLIAIMVAIFLPQAQKIEFFKVVSLEARAN